MEAVNAACYPDRLRQRHQGDGSCPGTSAGLQTWAFPRSSAFPKKLPDFLGKCNQEGISTTRRSREGRPKARRELLPRPQPQALHLTGTQRGPRFPGRGELGVRAPLAGSEEEAGSGRKWDPKETSAPEALGAGQPGAAPACRRRQRSRGPRWQGSGGRRANPELPSSPCPSAASKITLCSLPKFVLPCLRREKRPEFLEIGDHPFTKGLVSTEGPLQF